MFDIYLEAGASLTPFIISADSDTFEWCAESEGDWIQGMADAHLAQDCAELQQMVEVFAHEDAEPSGMALQDHKLRFSSDPLVPALFMSGEAIGCEVW